MIIRLLKAILLSGIVLCVCACNEKESDEISGTSEKVNLEWASVSMQVSRSAGGNRWMVSEDFVGISFETDACEPYHRGVQNYLFDATNVGMITLFRNAGIRVLRIGGVTVDSQGLIAINRHYVDRLFAFAKAANVKVIYSLPLLNVPVDETMEMARFVWNNYKDLLYCFSIGNEPESELYDQNNLGTYDLFLPKWKQYTKAVLDVIPDAKFTGPESGGYWKNNAYANFIDETKEAPFGNALIELTHHQYPSGNIYKDKLKTEILSPLEAIDKILSPTLLTGQYADCQKFGGDLAWSKRQMRCRMTEANDLLNGVDYASNAFAGALWALDYMGWQASHGLIGINFHNNQWIPTCTFQMDADHNFYVAPKAYATKAFDLIAGGMTETVSVRKPEDVNVTGYAVSNDKDGYLYLVMVNKGHGDHAVSAKVVTDVSAFADGAVDVMYLTARNNDPQAKTGVMLGGDTIENDREWAGQWTPIGNTENGKFIVSVEKTSAAIVRIPLKQV